MTQGTACLWPAGFGSTTTRSTQWIRCWELTPMYFSFSPVSYVSNLVTIHGNMKIPVLHALGKCCYLTEKNKMQPPTLEYTPEAAVMEADATASRSKAQVLGQQTPSRKNSDTNSVLLWQKFRVDVGFDSIVRLRLPPRGKEKNHCYETRRPYTLSQTHSTATPRWTHLHRRS